MATWAMSWQKFYVITLSVSHPSGGCPFAIQIEIFCFECGIQTFYDRFCEFSCF